MNTKELEKEATEYAQKLGAKDFIAKPKEIVAYFGYLAGAEPREKRIAELEQKLETERSSRIALVNKIAELEKEKAELKSIAENQQSSNMNRYFENKKLKEGLAAGSTFNKALNSMNKNLIEKSDKYRNMVFDKDEQLTKAKDHIKKLLDCLKQDTNDPETNYYVCQYMDKAEQFLNSEVEK